MPTLPTKWTFNGDLAADLGISDVSRVRRSQDIDTLDFTAPDQAFDADPLFATGATVIVRKDSDTFFTGRVVSNPRKGAPREENQAYSLAGPWWYLEHIVFQQAWTRADGTYNKSRVILGRTRDGARQATGSVIAEALDFAIAGGAPLSYEAAELISLDITPPTDEQLDLACSEVIEAMLRWHPDVSTWFDYSETVPVLHFTKRAAAVEKSFALAGAPVQHVNITRRDDLKISGVVIKYEITGEVDGSQYIIIQEDIAGASSGFDVLTLTIPLEGANLTFLKQKIVAEPPVINKAFWEEHEQWLDEEGISGVSITYTPPGELATYPNQLTQGSVQEWMNQTAVHVKFTAKCSYTDATGSKTEDRILGATLTLTDATSKTYWHLSSFIQGEDIPEDLAAKLYAALSQYHYQGSLALNHDEVPGEITPGNVLNLTSGRDEWATMRAQIEQVSEHLDTGSTTITFGPPEHLHSQDYIELLRANRKSRTAQSVGIRASGLASDGGAVAGDDAGKGPSARSSAGGGITRKLVITV